MEYIVNTLYEEWAKFASYSPRILAAAIMLIISYYLGKNNRGQTTVSKNVIGLNRKTVACPLLF